MDLCECKASLGYMKLNQSKRERELTPLFLALESYSFNPNTREVETGREMAGWIEGT